jgi:hypothetical protein
MNLSVKQYILFTLTTLFLTGIVYDSGANYNKCINVFYNVSDNKEYWSHHVVCSLKIIMDLVSICFSANVLVGFIYFIYYTTQSPVRNS